MISLCAADEKSEKSEKTLNGEEKTDSGVETQNSEGNADEEDPLGPNCYYDKSKSFFDNISCDDSRWDLSSCVNNSNVFISAGYWDFMFDSIPIHKTLVSILIYLEIFQAHEKPSHLVTQKVRFSMLRQILYFFSVQF